MRVLDLIKALAISGIVLFAAGCSDKKANGTTGGGGTTIPTEPPSVQVPANSLTQGNDGENRAVETQEDLDDFINVFRSAIDGYNSYYSKSQRALPEEYEKEVESSKESKTIIGNYSGKTKIMVEYSYEGKYTKTGRTATGYEIGTCEYFDFSNSNELFLGGAVGYLMTENEKENVRNNTIKANGTINFAGKYRGKVVFDSVLIMTKYEKIYDSEYDPYVHFLFSANSIFCPTETETPKKG